MTNTYSQLPPSSMSNFVPGHHPHSSSLSSLSSFAPQSHTYSNSHSHSPHASLSSSSPLPGPVGQVQTNHTRILLLADFPPSLKTKDLQEALSEWQDEPGGLKVKWRDDTSAWVVFGEPVVAKRAFLSLVTSPPPILTHSPSASSPSAPPIKIEPYTGPDVQQIIQAVQNRPRSRSIAGQGGAGGPGGAAAAVGVSSGSGSGHVGGGHSRKGSLLGSGGGSALGAAIASAQAAGPHGAATSSAAGGSPVSGSSLHGHGGHARTGSWQRSSLSSLSGFRAAVASNANGGGSSPTSGAGAGAPGEEGRSSPETPGAGIVGGGANGVVAGEAPRRFGGGGGGGVGGAGAGGHQRRESRSGSDSVAASVAGLTIQE